jgi:hypothetical protein
MILLGRIQTVICVHHKFGEMEISSLQIQKQVFKLQLMSSITRQHPAELVVNRFLTCAPKTGDDMQVGTI